VEITQIARLVHDPSQFRLQAGEIASVTLQLFHIAFQPIFIAPQFFRLLFSSSTCGTRETSRSSLLTNVSVCSLCGFCNRVGRCRQDIQYGETRLFVDS
jgi:hypothetical protein